VTARIIALCNQKGGVGKSTTTFHLARAAVLRGQRVLVVDNNPHGNLTSVAAAEPVDDDQAGLADALSSRAPETIRDVIVAGVWPGLDVVPTSGTTLGYVRQYYNPGLRVLAPPIPKRVVISDATEAARGLDEWGSAEATSLGAIYADHLTSIEGVQS